VLSWGTALSRNPEELFARFFSRSLFEAGKGEGKDGKLSQGSSDLPDEEVKGGEVRRKKGRLWSDSPSPTNLSGKTLPREQKKLLRGRPPPILKREGGFPRNRRVQLG